MKNFIEFALPIAGTAMAVGFSIGVIAFAWTYFSI